MSELSVAAISGLTESELVSLVCELLTAEGEDVKTVSLVASRDRAQENVGEPSEGDAPGSAQQLIVSREGEHLRLIEARRSGATPLAGISLPAVAARAAAVGADRASVFLSAALDADREANLSAVLEHVHAGTGVSVSLVDGQALHARIASHPELAAKYFPSEQDAEQAAAAQQIPAPLVRIAYAVAPKARTAPARSRRDYLRLVWTVAAVLVLIWLPVRLDPGQAKWVGGSGLTMIALAIVVAHRRKPQRSSRPRRGDSVMDTVIPVKDEQARGRDLTMRRLSQGPAGLTLDLIKEMPAVIVRMSTQTALLLFLVACSFAYMLLWGIDPGVCSNAQTCSHAFVGPGERAHAGDFMNLAVHAAFFNLPDTITPASRVAHGLVGAEFVLSAVLLGSYAAFFGFSDLRRPAAD